MQGKRIAWTIIPQTTVSSWLFLVLCNCRNLCKFLNHGDSYCFFEIKQMLCNFLLVFLPLVLHPIFLRKVFLKENRIITSAFKNVTFIVNGIPTLKSKRTYYDSMKKRPKIRIKWQYHFSHHIQRPSCCEVIQIPARSNTTPVKDNVEIYIKWNNQNSKKTKNQLIG